MSASREKIIESLVEKLNAAMLPVISKFLNQLSSDDEKDAPAPAKRVAKKPAPPVQEEESEEDEPAPPKKSAAKSAPKPTKKVVDSDESEEEEAPPAKKTAAKGPAKNVKKTAPVEEEEEDDEPAPPKKTAAKTPAKPAKKVEESEDEEESEEDTPAPPKKTAAKGPAKTVPKKKAPVEEEEDDEEAAPVKGLPKKLSDKKIVLEKIGAHTVHVSTRIVFNKSKVATGVLQKDNKTIKPLGEKEKAFCEANNLPTILSGKNDIVEEDEGEIEEEEEEEEADE